MQFLDGLFEALDLSSASLHLRGDPTILSQQVIILSLFHLHCGLLANHLLLEITLSLRNTLLHLLQFQLHRGELDLLCLYLYLDLLLGLIELQFHLTFGALQP